jgi:cell division transport system permease protein
MMRMFRALGYFLTEGLLGIRRHKTLHVFALFVVTLSLFVLGFSQYLTHNVNILLSAWQKNLEVRIFLKDGLSSEKRQALRDRLAGSPLTGSVEYVSPEQAMELLSKFSPAFSQISLGKDVNPLPASFSLHLKGPLDLDKVRPFLASIGKMEGVSQVLFDWQWVEKLRTYSRFVLLVGWVLFIALATAAVFTVAAITRILALSRREEIAILHLVGATPAGIRGPFIASGTLLGLLAASFSLLLLLGAHGLLHHMGGSSALLLHWISRDFLPGGTQLLLLFGGALLGAVGGVVSLGPVEHWTFH